MSSAKMKSMVMAARERQKYRFRYSKIRFNADMSVSDLKDYCILGTKEEKMLEQMFRSMDLSGRAYHRLLKTARTIADIEECEQINEYHLSEAVCFFGGMKGGVFNEK